MGHRYYRPGPERADRVRALFAAIASRYDLINDLQSLGLHRRWKRLLVRRAAPARGERALDLCCGTGDVAFRLEAAGARVVGADFSPPMLAEAERRAGMRSSGVAWVTADGLRLPFVAEAFGVVTLSYGLRNLPDFAAGLREVRRVTRRGGTLAILDFGKPSLRLWRAVYFAYLRLAVPVMGRLCCGDAAAYAYILESLRHFPDARGVSALLARNGWGQVEAMSLLGGVMGLHRAVRE